MEASKAEEIATSPDELQDLQDDQLIHQQTEPSDQRQATPFETDIRAELCSLPESTRAAGRSTR